MIIDLSYVTSVISSDVVISCILAFAAGLGGVMLYNRITSREKPTVDGYHANDAIVEAVVGEYTRRLQDYDKVIAELRMKMDIIEMRSVTTSQPPKRVVEEISQSHHATSQEPRYHAQRVTEPVTITQHVPNHVPNHILEELEKLRQENSQLAEMLRKQAREQEPKAVAVESNEMKNGTMDYILKMLAERPRPSREVQQAIGRSREHTSRLMKKLNDGGLITRDNESKPFKYVITALGQSRLREKAAEQGPRDKSTPFLDGS